MIYEDSTEARNGARTLTPTAHLVLGMVAVFGPMTSYGLEQRVAATVGSFWLFPHSQLYAEPRKLADAGLLEETVEHGGRRRRTYAITDAGSMALRTWFSEPEHGRSEARDLGLLKLFFADLAGPEAVRQLAEDQARMHRIREQELSDRRRELSAQAAGRHMLATLELGVRHASTFAEFWEELADDPDAA